MRSPFHIHPDRPVGGANRSRIRLRGLGARDRDLHAAHLLRLGPEDRRARFHSALSDRSVIAYSRGLDWNKAWVFGAFIDGTLRGVGELIPLDRPGEAELSISVEKPYQQAGLGKRLMLALILAARRTGMNTVRIIYIRDNDRMRALANDVGARSAMAPGIMEGVVTIPRTPAWAP